MSKKNIKNNIIPKDIDLQSLLREKKNELKKFEMNYRPISYWGLNPISTHLLLSVKSKNKRKEIKEFINRFGEHNLINNAFTKNKLQDIDRELISKIKIKYSNNNNNNDIVNVEIARLTMKSTLGDYISFRAKKYKDRIKYSIIDEYETNFNLPIKSSLRPLTLKQIIKFIIEATSDAYIDYSQVYGGARQSNYDDNDYDPEEFWDFEIIDSSYYNELYKWFNIQNYIWLIERKIERNE